MSYGLGVDLGTSFTGAAVSQTGPGGQASQPRMVALGAHSVLMPSVVQVRPDGSLSAGDTLDAESDDDPARTVRDFKRRLGDPTPLVLGGQPHSAASLLAATLKSVVEAVTAAEGSPPERVVLTYPAVWGPYRREQFAEVPRRAGLDDGIVTVTTEPEAAAGHYATRHQLTQGDLVAVYDLGGGTFDTTVTRVSSPSTSGSPSTMEILGAPEGVEWVGGVDFDEAILAHVDRATGGAVTALDPRHPGASTILQHLRRECIRAKETLSQQQSTTIAVHLPGRQIDVPLSREQFEDMIRTPLQATLAALHRTLTSAGISPAELAGVLLVGGSSRIPLVAQMLTDDLGRPVLLDPQPQQRVALGAADLAGGAATGERVAASAAVAVETLSPRRAGGHRRRWIADRRRRTGERLGAAGLARRRNRRRAAVVVGTALAIAGWTYSPLSPLSPLKDGPEQNAGALNPILDPAPALPSTSSPLSTPSLLPTASLSPQSSSSPSVATASLTASPATTSTAPGSTTKATPTRKPSPTRTTSAPTKPTPSPTKPTSKPTPRPVTGTGRVIGIGGECLDVANAVSNPGVTVQIFHCNGTGAQAWTAGTNGTLVALGKCLDAASPGVGSRVEINNCNGSPSQTWQLLSGAIKNPQSALCLDVRGGSSADYTPLVTATCGSGAGQKWTLST